MFYLYNELQIHIQAEVKTLNLKRDFAEILGNMEIVYKLNLETNVEDRFVICSVCNNEAKRSIVPHLRKKHPAIWKIFLNKMREKSNQGMRPMKIQIEIFDSLFSWNVVQRELTKLRNKNPKEFNIPQRSSEVLLEPSNSKDLTPSGSIWRFSFSS